MRVNTYTTLQDENKIPTLVKEFGKTWQGENLFNNPNIISKMLIDIFNVNKLTEERVYLLALDYKLHLIGVMMVSHGNVCGSHCGTREVLMKSLLLGASNIVLAHNHPSGDIEPSLEDMKTARYFKEACPMVGLNLVDFIIIGGDSVKSFENNGFFERV